MSLAVGLAGWALSAALLVAVLRLGRRLELAARACHELRGPATALGLAVAALARQPGGSRRALPIEAQLDRLSAGLDDLEAARSGKRAEGKPADVPLDRLLRGTAAGWRPAARAEGRRLRIRSELGATVVRADRGRLAQALGNLLANAVEHGSGTVELLGRRGDDHVVLEVRDEGPGRGPSAAGRSRRPGGSRAGRGRGLGIAAGAIEEAGGQLTLDRRDGGTVAALELPATDP